MVLMAEAESRLRTAAADLSDAVAGEQADGVSSAWKKLDTYITVQCLTPEILKESRGGAYDMRRALLQCLGTCWGVPRQFQDRRVLTRLVMAAAAACGLGVAEIDASTQVQLAQQFMKAENFLAALATAVEDAASSLQSLPASQLTEEQISNEFMYCEALMMLFHAINKAWPGTAGILTARSYQHAAQPAVALAAALIAAAGTAAATAAEGEARVNAYHKAWFGAAVPEALRATVLIVKQLLSKLPQAANDRTGQQFLQSPAFLHLVLLLLDMQLQASATEAACSSSAAAVTHLQQYHQKVLESFNDLQQWQWDSGQALIASENLKLSDTAYVSFCLFAKLVKGAREWLMAAVAPRGDHSSYDAAVCSLLPSLIHVFVETALSNCNSKIPEEQETAECVLMAAHSAACLWGSSLFHTFWHNNREHLNGDGQRAIEVLKAVIPALQQLLQPAASTECPNSLGHLNRSSDTAADDAKQQRAERMCTSLLHLAQKLLATVTMCCEADEAEGLDLQALPAAEHMIRTAADTAAALLDGNLEPMEDLTNELWLLVQMAYERAYRGRLESRRKSAADESSSSSSRVQKAHGGYRWNFSLLLSWHKFLGKVNSVFLSHSSGSSKAVEMLSFMSQQPIASLPWLVLLSRHSCRTAQQAAVLMGQMQQADTAGDGQPDAALLHHALLEALAVFTGVVRVFSMLYEVSEVVRYTEQHCAEACPEPDMPSSTALLEHPGVAELQQQFQQELLPSSLTAYRIYEYTGTMVSLELDENPACTADTLRVFRSKLTADEATVADSLEAAASHAEAVALLAAHPQYGVCLLQQLEAAAEQVCALLPLPLCCNNPGCGNMSGESELQLVGGKACVCAGCEVARYCGRECQAAHWQAHKKVCKMIKESKAAAAVDAAAVVDAAAAVVAAAEVTAAAAANVPPLDSVPAGVTAGQLQPRQQHAGGQAAD